MRAKNAVDKKIVLSFKFYTEFVMITALYFVTL